MSELAQPYIRRNYGCQAVQVTEKNLYKVAGWCGGQVKRARINDRLVLFIELPVTFRKGVTPKRAHVGEWVILDTNGFKVYDNKEFNVIFKPWPA